MRPDKIHALTLQAIESLIHAAERIDSNHGHDAATGERDSGSDWVDLRYALQRARHAMAREGVKVSVMHPASVETQGVKVENYYGGGR